MLNGIKRCFYLLVFLFGIFYSTLDLKSGESMEVTVETEQKKTNCIVKVDTRPTLEIKYLYYEDVEEEIRFGEMERIAQLVQAEAGNQDLTGKRYVVDVVLNRVDSDKFPNTVEEVIFQENQFSVIKDGAFEKAGWEVSKECYEAVILEYEERLNYNILYFGTEKSKYADQHFRHQDHYFGW